MKKILHRYFFLMIAASCLFFFGFWLLTTHQMLSNQIEASLKREAQHLKQLASLENELPADILLGEDFRYTLISQTGEVLFDNDASATDMDSHLSRKEVRLALEKGEGSARRHSETLNKDYFYHAIHLDNGNILRIATTVSSIWELIFSVVPILSIFLITSLVLSGFLSKKLSANLLSPLEKIDLSGTAQLTEIYDELIPFAKKIGEQKEEIISQAKELKSQQQNLSAILENMKEGILLLNADETVLLANQTALYILDAQIKWPRQTTLLELSQNQQFLSEARLALQGENRFMQLEEKNKAYGVYFSPTAFWGCVILFIDLTDLMRAEKIRREFSANVSHELKTPLTSISAYAEMISSGIAKGDAVNDFAHKIHQEALHLTGLISDILLISEIEEGEINLETEDVDLFALCQNVIMQLEKPAKEKNIDISFSGTKAVLQGRQNHFYEIIFNILQNAIKYTPQGGHVYLRLNRINKQITIEVEDTGIGIPQKNIDRVFERFYRVDKSRYKKTGGTGLGLSIVKHLVHLYNGQVSIKSQEHVGTVVTVIIPVEDEEDIMNNEK